MPADKDARRRYHLMKRYGITLEDYEAIKAVQGGTCFLCKRARGVSRPLQVDHDHSLTGRDSVRGLLCGRDNNRLGWYEARAELVAVYLDTPPARWVLK